MSECVPFVDSEVWRLGSSFQIIANIMKTIKSSILTRASKISKKLGGALPKGVFIAVTALAGMGLAQTCQATLTWNFVTASNQSGDVGSSKSYSASGYNLTASGFNSNGTSRDLYQKWTSSINNSETGLGLDTSSQHEIQVGQFIQLYFPTSTFAKNQFDNLTFHIGSVQNGEGWAIYGSSTAGQLGSPIASGIGGNTDSYSISGTDWQNNTYFSLLGTTKGNVLLMNGVTLQTSSVPEPSTVVAGVLLLLPFSVSTLRILRKHRLS